ncbi:MAG: ABC transporter substrate-binding protein [Promethearchaeota archaeon]
MNPISLILSLPSQTFTISSTPDLAQPKHLIIGAMGIPDEWDPAVSEGYNILSEYYSVNCLESVLWVPDKSLDLKPNLATTWDVEYWPEELNTMGFINTGGIKSITFTLRENVQFHDGSDWNATVFKWNIDRINIISGNYTGLCQNTEDNNAEGNNMHTILVEDFKPYFTPSWNMSQYDSPNLGTTPPATDPGVNDYAYYNLGPNASLVDYGDAVNPLILPNNTFRNPNPYGGWDYAAGAAIHYAPYDRYSIINYVEILENPQSGGKVKVHFNHWTTSGLAGGTGYPMISYNAYRQDYTTRGIYGYENGVDDPRNAGPLTHMIGTGPYIYGEYDETGSQGYIMKNQNYWNRTALEINDWFDADIVDIIVFPTGQLGTDAMNIALLTHALDYVVETSMSNLDYDAVTANPNINYLERGVSDYISTITMNCINETWWAWPWADMWRRGCYTGAGDKPSGGIPRAMREAMSYAFNYDLYINTAMDGRVVRSGLLGIDNIYYNSSIPLADYNVTKAREILLTTETDPILFNISTPVPHEPTYIYKAGYPFGDHNAISLNPDNYNFSKMCAVRGLTVSSSDLDWQAVADVNPIYTFNFYWDSIHEDVKSVLLVSLKNIGCTLKDTTGVTNRVPTIIWDTVRIGHLTTFDGTYGIFSSNGWVMDEFMPPNSPESNLYWATGDPDSGRWRTQGASGITSWHYWGNFGFNFDADVDYWLERITLSDQTTKMNYISKIVEKEQTEIFPKIYISQGIKGLALWNDWEMNLIRGDHFFASFRYVPPSPPGEVELTSDAGTPDIDGNFNLVWNVSIGADNYTIYRYNHEITEINGSLIPIAYQTATSPHPIFGLTDGEYYFIVVAHNENGDTLSNNFHISVQLSQDPPQSFILSSDADFPDNDGFFNLSWTYPDGADNYSLYMDDQQITVIDNGVTLLLDQIATSPFPVTGLTNGEYYFVVVAHNKYGDTMSNNVHITVNIPGGAEDILGYNTILISCIAIFTAIFLYKKRRFKLDS